MFGTSSEESSNANENSPDGQGNADSGEGRSFETTERQVAGDGRADNTNTPLAKLTSESNLDAGRANHNKDGMYFMKKTKTVD